MIKVNPENGEFVILPSGSILSSRLTRSQFLSSPEGIQSKIQIQNEPWCSFRFEEQEESLLFVVQFKSEKLDAIEIYSHGLEFGVDWKDWSNQKELERKKANDAWLLKNNLLPDDIYRWGSVWSGYDAKSASSVIVIRYITTG